jgi:hypothetical protein
MTDTIDISPETIAETEVERQAKVGRPANVRLDHLLLDPLRSEETRGDRPNVANERLEEADRGADRNL